MAQTAKNLPAKQETWVWSLSLEDSLEKGMATHSRILAWKIPWTEEPGGLQSRGLQKVRHNWVTNTHFYHCKFLDNSQFLETQNVELIMNKIRSVQSLPFTSWWTMVIQGTGLWGSDSRPLPQGDPEYLCALNVNKTSSILRFIVISRHTKKEK